MEITAALLSGIIGLLFGFYGQSIYAKLSDIYEHKRDEIEARQVGVIRPVGRRVTTGQPIDLSSETGSVIRPRPAAVEEIRKADRDRILQDNHL